MFAHNKVARGISLHWGTSNLIVLTIIVAMLGTTQFALAMNKPFPCWSCCPNGPLCANQDNFYYRRVVGASAGFSNYEVAGTRLTSTQWNFLAASIQNWQAEADNDGTMFELTLFVKENKALFEAPSFNTSNLVAGMQSLGFKGTQAQMAGGFATWSQAQRIAFYNAVYAHGMDYIYANIIVWIQAMAKMVEAREHGGVLYPYGWCDFASDAMWWGGFASAGAFLIGQPKFGGPLMFISATAGLAGHEGGCF